jgi:ATP-dependent DNA helicase PIF1
MAAKPASVPTAGRKRSSLSLEAFAWPKGVTPTPEYLAAARHMIDGCGHLFVTGRAGTGKSTLLRAIRDNMGDEVVVVAPTGLAAVNVGGQTIHSFFGLPPRLIRPDDIKRSRNGRVMRKLTHLVIDEVSMVRSDLMWGIDQSLRINRGRPREPFGGLQLMLFGDLHQLPPVVQEHEVGDHLDETYGGPFFFSAPGLREGDGTRLLELSQVFRQSEGPLLTVLNRMRDGDIAQSDFDAVNKRVVQIRTLSEGDPYVILTPTNAAAGRINQAYLNALKTKAHSYKATTTGEFKDSSFPTETELTLKVGAKVILLRNDADKRWVNGSVARVSKLTDTAVWIEIDGVEYELEAVSWENRRYAFDVGQDKVVETVAGTFKQFPLRLAWALTIHKSQGLTLDKVYIDLTGGTFAHGQAYVALSRCRTLEGLALKRPLTPRDVLFDRAAMGYRDLFPALEKTS